MCFLPKRITVQLNCEKIGQVSFHGPVNLFFGRTKFKHEFVQCIRNPKSPFSTETEMSDSAVTSGMNRATEDDKEINYNTKFTVAFLCSSVL